MRNGDKQIRNLVKYIEERHTIDNRRSNELIDILDDICIDFEYEPKKLYRRLQEEMDWWWKDEL